MRFLLLWLLSTTVALADAPSRGDLSALREQINALEQRLAADRGAHDKATQSLRQVEKALGQLAREARSLERQRSEAASRLAALRDQQDTLVAENERQLAWVVRTIRAGYQSGAQPSLKLLLNQEQPDQVARLLRYQDYFNQARQTRMASIRTDLDELREVTRKVNDARDTLLAREQAVQEKQQRMAENRREREQALALLDKRLSDSSTRLERLRKDESELAKLLSSMQQTLNDIPASPQGEPFGRLANKLPWPVTRKITARFGSRREGPLRWNGVLLEARQGTPVRTIHPGRVVYADWLRGYGLLTIVDHGDGFLSLYGHNQSLLREVGEWVALGDTLALAGDSGGRSEAGLYFEIRRDGKPVNPDKWCNSRVTLPALGSL